MSEIDREEQNSHPSAEERLVDIEMISREDYLEQCKTTAIEGGFIKEEEVATILHPRHSIPIYDAYEGTLTSDDLTDAELKMAMPTMNSILRATQSIGSREPDAIMRSVEEDIVHLRELPSRVPLSEQHIDSFEVALIKCEDFGDKVFSNIQGTS